MRSVPSSVTYLFHAPTIRSRPPHPPHTLPPPTRAHAHVPTSRPCLTARPMARFQGRWTVRLRNGEGKNIKTANIEPVEGADGRVLVFWGDARWSRAQLLGEIARGHWWVKDAEYETPAPLQLPPAARRSSSAVRCSLPAAPYPPPLATGTPQLTTAHPPPSTHYHPTGACARPASLI